MYTVFLFYIYCKLNSLETLPIVIIMHNYLLMYDSHTLKKCNILVNIPT